MPGTPDPVLGSDALTIWVATVVAAVVASAPYVFRDRLSTPGRTAVAGGLGYAAVCLAAWAGARLATDAFVPAFADSPLALAGFALLGVVVLGAQAAIPYYCYARWRLLAPLGALFVVTWLVLPAFLRVRGETDPLVLYLVFGPLLVGLTCLVGLAEFGLRRVVVRK